MVVMEEVYRKQRRVLVKWKGLDIVDATWKPIEAIRQVFLDEFHGLRQDDEEDDDNDDDSV